MASRPLIAALLAISVFTSSTALAQLTLDDVSKTASVDAERIAKLLSALDNPDPIFRLEVLRRIVEEGSDIERRLALQKAFNSTDMNLRNAALKYRLVEMPTLRVSVARPGKEGERMFGPNDVVWLDFTVQPKDLRTGLFTFDSRDGYVIDDTLVMAFLQPNMGACSITFGIDDAQDLEGDVTCSDLPPMKAKAPLF